MFSTLGVIVLIVLTSVTVGTLVGLGLLSILANVPLVLAVLAGALIFVGLYHAMGYRE